MPPRTGSSPRVPLARKGTFGSGLTPFGGGVLSDLSVYQIGAAPAAPTPLTPTPFPQPTYTAADPPPAPTVAPEVGVLPQPTLPRPTLPWIYLNPDTSAAREEIRQRALAAGKTPTTAQINATYAANKARLLAELLAAGG